MSTKIASVKIKGFKSHLSTEFNYAPGLTVVTGPTDSGKSAGVMQPIKWVVFGEPSGEAFIFTIRDPKTKEVIRQAEAIEVEIHLDGGLVITKTRRKGKTSYYINGRLISEKAEVPEEVKEALGLSKQAYGDFETSLNFAYQLEAPFILSETASVGAKVLGKLAGTEVVDKAIAAIMKRTYKSREEKNMAQKIIDQVNVELIEFLQVDDLLTKVEACEALLAQLEQDTSRVDIVGQLAARYSIISDKIDNCNRKLERLAVIKDIAQDIEVIELAQACYEALMELYRRWDVLEATQIPTVNWRLEDLKDVGKAAVLLDQVENDYNHYTQLDGYFKGFTSFTAAIKAREASLDQYKELSTATVIIQEVGHDFDLMTVISGLNENLTALDVHILESKALVSSCKEVKQARALLDSLELDEAAAKLLHTQIVSLQVIDSRKKQLEDRINVFGILPECKEALDKAVAEFDQLTTLRQLMEDYEIKQMATEAVEKRVTVAVTALKEAEAELKAAWEAGGDVCPLCERPRADDHIRDKGVGKCVIDTGL